MPKFAYAPNGLRIIGTLEEVDATANALVFWDDETNAIELLYTGHTTIHWDTQLTVMDETGAHRMFEDTQGGEWPENQLLFREEES
jgi:N-acetyl-beta-hexosaminidase